MSLPDNQNRAGQLLLSVALGLVLFVYSGDVHVSGQESGTSQDNPPAPAEPSSSTQESEVLDPAVLLKEAASLARSNRNGEAVEKLRRCLAAAPAMPEAHHTLGLVLAKQGKMADAIAEMKQAVDLSPASDSSLLALGGFYQSNGNVNEALDTYAVYQERFPQSSMKAKVNALIKSLKEMRSRGEVAKSQDESLNPDRKPQAVNSSKSTNDDYLAFMQEKGIKRWPGSRLPITVYVKDGRGVSGFRDSFRLILLRSFEDWAKASGGLVRFQIVDNPENARLTCFWTDNPRDLRSLAEAGEARVFEDENYICKAEICFLTQGTRLTDNQFRVVSLHEIGHCLGLSGHTTDPADIMFYSNSFADSWRELSGRDARSITRLYQNDL